jgi:hypothetical protein
MSHTSWYPNFDAFSYPVNQHFTHLSCWHNVSFDLHLMVLHHHYFSSNLQQLTSNTSHPRNKVPMDPTLRFSRRLLLRWSGLRSSSGLVLLAICAVIPQHSPNLTSRNSQESDSPVPRLLRRYQYRDPLQTDASLTKQHRPPYYLRRRKRYRPNTHTIELYLPILHVSRRCLRNSNPRSASAHCE